MARFKVSNSVRNREREGGVSLSKALREVAWRGVQRPMKVTAGVGLVGGLFAGSS